MGEYDDSLEIGVPAAYYDTWNRHNSIAFSNYKGLQNAPGENNCFLNSAVQVFWHLDVFRRSYRRLTGHSCMGNSCIFCALKAIFTQFQYSDQSSLPPDTLRKALAETFVDQHRYQIGHMDDAAECFENILRRLHLHVANEHNEDTCTAAHCISHQKFAMTVFDQLVCPCGAKTDPLRFHELVHYVSASALVSQAKKNQATGDILHPDRFGLLLRNAAAMGDIRNCPSNCGKSVQMRRTLLNLPDVVSIGLIWDSERPNGEVVTDVIRSLGTTIMLQDVFHSVMSEDGRLPKLTLSAVVCYYGKHYSTFVFNTKLKSWIYFDDATVREIGPHWEDVVQKCVRSRYQPLLLLYTNPYPTLLPVQTAPQRTTMHPGYKMTTQVSPEAPKQKRSDSRAAFAQQRAAVGRRAITPGPEMTGNSSDEVEPQIRRAITPGPEHTSYEPERDGIRRGGFEHSRHNSFLVAMNDRPEPNRGNNQYYPDPSQDQALMGEYVYNNGLIQPSYKQFGNGMNAPDCNTYQRQNMSPLFGKVNQSQDIHRTESFKKGHKAHGDVIRYMVDQQVVQNTNDSRNARASKGRHTRSRSQSYEDTLSVSSETNPHVAKTKSTSNAYNMDNGQAIHGPVQSGLATLPRKKGDQRNCKTPSPSAILNSADQSHERQGSASSSGSVVLNPKYQQMPVNSSRGEYMDQKHFICKPEAAIPKNQSSENIHNNPNHWRQVSASSQSSQSTLTPSDPTYQGFSHSHQSSVSSQISNHPHHGRPRVILPGGAPPASNGPATDPVNQDYISSNMVHKILSKQRVQRQASSASSHSVRSNTSNSSIESDISLQKHLKAKSGKDSLSVEIPYDNLSLESQKDSGYSGSDRNSSSSSGSVTMDPFSQYFISRSMIPPKSVNDYAFMHNFTESFKESLANMKKDDVDDSPYEPVNFNGQPPNDYTVNYVQQQQQQLSQKGLNQNSTANNSYSLQDREQIENNKNIQKPRKTKTSSGLPDNSHILANSRDYKNLKPNTDLRVPPIDSDNLINFKSGIQVQDILPGYSEATSKSVVSDEFSGLCHKAEEMMDRCMLCETSGEITDAINNCNAAVSYLKQAMQMPGVSQQSFIFAQCKHNSCIMKHRSLLKQAPSNLDGNVSSASSETLNSLSANRSSMTSTDSDGSQRDLIHLDSQGKTQKDVFKDKLQGLYQQGIKQNSQPQGRVAGRQPGVKPPPPQRGVSIGSKSIPVKHDNRPSQSPITTSSVNKDSNSVPSQRLNGIPNNGQNSRTQMADNQSRDDELYQTYLNRQRSLAAGIKSGQSSSGTSTPTSSLDGSEGSRDMPPGTYMGKSYSKAQIRQMLQQNMVHRQHPQSVTPVRVQQQSTQPSAYSGTTNPRTAPYPQDNMVRSGIRPPFLAQKPSVPSAGSKPKIACKPVTTGDSKAQSAAQACVRPVENQQHANHTGSLERRMSQPVYNQHYGACSSEHTFLAQSSHLARDKTTWSTYCSQPDLSSSGVETEYPSFPPPASLSAPSTPAHSSENLHDIDSKPSVKDIASRFEATSISSPRAGRRSMEPEGKRQTPLRQRSKSESSSGPRTVLKKKKKLKARAARKSVTFSDSIALIAAAEELPPGPAPPPYEEAISSRGQDRLGWEDTDTYYGYDSDDDIVKVVPAGYHDDDYCDKDSCGSSESPVESGEVMCSLCRKNGAEPGVSYCSNCSFYMSRFQPNR